MNRTVMEFTRPGAWPLSSAVRAYKLAVSPPPRQSHCACFPQTPRPITASSPEPGFKRNLDISSSAEQRARSCTSSLGIWRRLTKRLRD